VADRAHVKVAALARGIGFKGYKMSIAAKLLPDEPLVPNFLAPIGPPTGFAKYSAVPGSPLTIALVPEPPPEGYEARLCANKVRLKSALASLGIQQERQLLITAMAMQETGTMSPLERDWSKDNNSDRSENHSIFNLNTDFIYRVTNVVLPKPLKDLSSYTGDRELKQFIDIIDKACDKWPIYQMLAFHRGGGSTNDTFAPGFKSARPADWTAGRRAISNYIAAIKTIIVNLEQNDHLRANELRVNIDVPYLK
jgi:hypothetical protein